MLNINKSNIGSKMVRFGILVGGDKNVDIPLSLPVVSNNRFEERDSY